MAGHGKAEQVLETTCASRRLFVRQHLRIGWGVFCFFEDRISSSRGRKWRPLIKLIFAVGTA